MSTSWKTSLSKVTKNNILIRGYRVSDLMEHCSFGDLIYLTFTGNLPTGKEGHMLETIVISSTDHFFLAPSVNSTRFVASGGVSRPWRWFGALLRCDSRRSCNASTFHDLPRFEIVFPISREIVFPISQLREHHCASSVLSFSQ